MPAGSWANSEVQPYLAQLCDPSFKVFVHFNGSYRQLKPGVERVYWGNGSQDYETSNHFHVYGDSEISDEWINGFIGAARNAGGVITCADYRYGMEWKQYETVVDFQNLLTAAAKVAEYCGLNAEQCREIKKGYDECKKVVREALKQPSADGYYPDVLDEWLKGQSLDVSRNY